MKHKTNRQTTLRKKTRLYSLVTVVSDKQDAEQLDCHKLMSVVETHACSHQIPNSPAVKPPILNDACIGVRIKYFLQFHDLWTLLNKIREGVALSPLSILHKNILCGRECTVPLPAGRTIIKIR